MTSMSAGPVFMSELVKKLPPSEATRSPYRASRSRRRGPPGRSCTARTAFPPPNGSPATASFVVIPADRRIASRSPSAGASYVFRRVPPAAGPSFVEWRQTKIHASPAGSRWMTVRSPSQLFSSSSNDATRRRLHHGAEVIAFAGAQRARAAAPLHRIHRVVGLAQQRAGLAIGAVDRDTEARSKLQL